MATFPLSVTNLEPFTLHPSPFTLHPFVTLSPPCPTTQPLKHKPLTLNPKSSTLDRKSDQGRRSQDRAQHLEPHGVCCCCTQGSEGEPRHCKVPRYMTLHPAPCTLHPAPCTLHPKPRQRGKAQALQTLNHRPQNRHKRVQDQVRHHGRCRARLFPKPEGRAPPLTTFTYSSALHA